MITFVTQPTFFQSRFEYVRLFLVGDEAFFSRGEEVALEEGVEVVITPPNPQLNLLPNLEITPNPQNSAPNEKEEDEVVLGAPVRPVVVTQPVITTKPIDVPKPLTDTQPTTVAQPVVATQPIDVPQPISQTQPVAATQPVAITASLATTKPFVAPQPTLAKTILNWVLSGLVVVSISIVMVLVIPQLYYAIFPSETVPIKAQEEGTAFGGAFEQGAQPEEPQKYVSPQDPSLPEGDWLIIPKIGVRSQPQVTLDPEEALATGVWRVPDFGKPGDTDIPMILVSHRFGWQWWWKTDYWKYHSFYLLPDVQPGDRVEFISDQRKWVYEIYAGEEGEEITDYEADLILYTCKYLNSPVRHFRYARLIDPTQNTQASSPESV